MVVVRGPARMGFRRGFTAHLVSANNVMVETTVVATSAVVLVSAKQAMIFDKGLAIRKKDLRCSWIGRILHAKVRPLLLSFVRYPDRRLNHSQARCIRL